MVPKERVFLHGKTGVIEAADGAKICFLGSINETKRAFAGNYEILWEDTPRRGGHCAVGSVFADPGATRCGGAPVGAVVTARFQQTTGWNPLRRAQAGLYWVSPMGSLIHQNKEDDPQ